MKLSLNTIRFINQHNGSAGDPAPNGVDALEQRIGAQLGAIEETIDFGKKFKEVVIVKVITCTNHPNADRLHVCKVDDGGKVEGVERDEQGHVQVVCGAPNVREGMLAAWLPPGSTVPNTVDKDPFVMELREIRGQKSNGMMASPKELSIGDGHEGILEVDKEVAPGTPFTEAYNLEGEVIIDIENKMFTHRPDCFGFIGIARELEGIQHRPYVSPGWYKLQPEFPAVESDPLPLEVKNELPDIVPRFTAITMRDVIVKPSPVWLQILLTEVGLRPINNIVDYTNFYMMVTGQPLHAYDYDKVMSQDEGANHATLMVRYPREGEKIMLINGKEVQPRPETIMIASRDKLLGVGGTMGGSETEVDENTKSIIIEVATFDMYSIRRTGMAHGLFTDAATRFNKGQSPLQNLCVLAKIVDEIRQSANGKVASKVIDINYVPREVLDRGSIHAPIRVSPEFINIRLGLKLSIDEMAQLLKNVEFDVQNTDSELAVRAPFWRTDIEMPEDIVEEIGRLHGYDHLLLELPKRDLSPASKNKILEFKQKAREILRQAGANEVLTYSFVHGNLLDKVGQDKERAYRIANALSPDLQYYRLSLLPSLLERVHSNIKNGYDEFALFEIGKAHEVSFYEDSESDIPGEVNHLAFVYAASEKSLRNSSSIAGAPYYEAKKYLEALLSSLGITNVTFSAGERDPVREIDRQAVKPFAAGRMSFVKIGDEVVAVVGELRGSTRKALKLPEFVAGFELDIDALSKYLDTEEAGYTLLPRFPKLEQDICLKVGLQVSYGELFEIVHSEIDRLKPQQSFAVLIPVDIYQRDSDIAHKQITFRLSIASFERTLTDGEVAKLLDDVAAIAHGKVDAERI